MALVSPLKSTLFAFGSEFYEISDEFDDGVSGFSGDFEYYGYVNSNNQNPKWIIQRHQISTGQWRYLNGVNSYPTIWAQAIAGSLVGYDYYYKMFNTTP